MRSPAPLHDQPWWGRGARFTLPVLLLALATTPSRGFGQGVPPRPVPPPSAVPRSDSGEALVPASESLDLLKRAREAVADKQWDVAVEAYHSLLARLQRPAGESWETLDPRASSVGLAESVRAALRALPEEAKAIARQRYDDAARKASDEALASGNTPALLGIIRSFPLASCLPQVYLALARSASETHRWERARAWAERGRTEAPAAFAASPALVSTLATACARLHDAAALDSIIDSIETADPSAPPPTVEGPTPGSVVPLLDFCRSLRPLAQLTHPPPRVWRPGDLAPALGAIGPRVWSWSIFAGTDPLAVRVRGLFPGRARGGALFPYQPVAEGNSLWLHGGLSIIRLDAATGEIESSRTIASSNRFGNPDPETPESRAGCVTITGTPSWLAAVVGLPLSQRVNIPGVGVQPRGAKLIWVDRASDVMCAVDAAAEEGPLTGSVPSAVPVIAVDLPVLWRYVAAETAPDGRNMGPISWSASLCCLDPANGGARLWESTPVELRATGNTVQERGPVERHGLMAVDETRLVVCDNTAIIAGVDALTGALQWAYPYAEESQVMRPTPEVNARPGDFWEANPILIVEGIALVCPFNSASLFAIDVATGRRMWVAPRERARYLLGVRKGTVFISGDWVSAWELRSGKKRWPLETLPEVRWSPGGRGLVAEDGVFVPTTDGLRVLDPDSGETRQVYAWRLPGAAVTTVGNLAVAAGSLIVAGEEDIFAFRTDVHPIPAESLAETLEQIFRDLRGNSYDAREAAGSKLIEIGAAAIPVLDRARTDADPEIVWRAHKLLDVIRDAQILVPVTASSTPPKPPR